MTTGKKDQQLSDEYVCQLIKDACYVEHLKKLASDPISIVEDAAKKQGIKRKMNPATALAVLGGGTALGTFLGSQAGNLVNKHFPGPMAKKVTTSIRYGGPIAASALAYIGLKHLEKKRDK